MFFVMIVWDDESEFDLVVAKGELFMLQEATYNGYGYAALG